MTQTQKMTVTGVWTITNRGRTAKRAVVDGSWHWRLTAARSVAAQKLSFEPGPSGRLHTSLHRQKQPPTPPRNLDRLDAGSLTTNTIVGEEARKKKKKRDTPAFILLYTRFSRCSYLSYCIMANPNAGHFFQTSESLIAEQRKASKAQNKLGNPIRLSSKLLAVTADPFDERAVYVAEAAGEVRRVVLEVSWHSFFPFFISPKSDDPLWRSTGLLSCKNSTSH